jgi:hypothetical protein
VLDPQIACLLVDRLRRAPAGSEDAAENPEYSVGLAVLCGFYFASESGKLGADEVAIQEEFLGIMSIEIQPLHPPEPMSARLRR